MAHIEKRQRRDGDGKLGPVKWRARYVDPDGCERSRTFATKSAAQDFLDAQAGAMIRGDWIAPETMATPFEVYAEEWRKTKADVSERTRVNVEGRLRNHVLPAFEGLGIGAIRPTHVRSWVAGLVADGYAPSTVKGIYQCASQIFETATIDGVIPKSPCVGIDLPRERERVEMHFLTAEQVHALADAFDDRYRALVVLAAYSGLRAGELHGLRVARVNVLAGTIDVVEAASEVHGRFTIGPTKTGKRRSVPIPRPVAELVGEHVGRYPSDDGFVFTAGEGGPVLHRNFMRRHFVPAAERSKMPEGLRFHDLRHTCAAFLIARGHSLQEVKDHLGHSSIRVTSDSYGHLYPESRTARAASLEAVFASALEAPTAHRRPTGEIAPLRRRSR